MAKTRVAVLGGGLGAMAAAYELTCNPELRGRFEVTVYQQGWRLGGKGASGRNAARGERIEEHGLHAFLGFYENAFALMRDLYSEWGHLEPNARWKSWRDAFEPQRQVTVEEWVPPSRPGARGHYVPWNLPMPWLPGEPGDGKPVPLVERLVVGMVQLIADWIADLLHHEPRVFAELALHQARVAPRVVGDLLTGDYASAITAVNAALAEFEARSDLDDALRRLVLSVQLGGAIVRGLLTEVLPRGESAGFAYIDQWDFKAWLERHGASQRVSFWGPVRALYDLGFAYEGGVGDVEHASAAAGVSLRILMLLGLGYKDAPLWKMKAGMGDTIFGPLYRVLAARGVRFEFFHRVTNLGLSNTGNLVQRIELVRQVDLAHGRASDGYDPLVTVKDLPCWPSEPHWDQIEDGAAIKARLDAEGLTLESAWCDQRVGTRTLVLGEHFDRVVLGISVGALADVARELVDGREEWRRMIASSRTVQTQALQLWLDRDTAGLGWKDGTTIMTGFVEPFDTWGDMSHLLAEETWPAPGAPKSLAYFCNALPDAHPIPPFTDRGFPRRERERVFADAAGFLEQHLGTLWPAVIKPGHPPTFDWSVLHDPSGAVGVARLEAQYVRANVDPTERYVLSPPGSIAFRLAPGDSGYLNVVLAGDWVSTSLNGGCAEAAVEGGLRAAHALIGYAPRPFLERHVLDDSGEARARTQ